MTTTQEQLSRDSGPHVFGPKLRVKLLLKERFPGVPVDTISAIAGISRKKMGQLLDQRLFGTLEPVLRLALAIGVSIESFFSRELVGDIKDEIRDRRSRLSGDSSPER